MDNRSLSRITWLKNEPGFHFIMKPNLDILTHMSKFDDLLITHSGLRIKYNKQVCTCF
jgi:hypothetical protein